MKDGGIALIILSAILLLVAFFMKTSVSSYSAFGGSGDVINIGLLQNQMMVWQLGLALFVTGGVLFAAGSILEALREGGVVPKPEPAGTEDRQGKVCEWCGVAFKYPLMPCSSVTPEMWEDPKTKITLERCREELTGRGIKFHMVE